MSDNQHKCKLAGCDERFTPKNPSHVFHDPKCKAAYHRSHPYDKYPIVTVVDTKTGKGGIDTVVRCSLDDRTKMAEHAVPGRKFRLVPLIDDMF